MSRYKMKTIAQRSGYAPELLRAWEKRYGLLQPLRSETGHRLYTDDDLQVLAEIRRQLEQGRSIGEVAAGGREALLRTPTAQASGRAERWRQLALSHSLNLDVLALERLLDEALAEVGPDLVIESIMLPTAVQIGNLWEQGQAPVAAEHLQSAVYARRLEGLIEANLRYARPQPMVLLSCLEGEGHELGARLAHYYLVRAGVAPVYVAPGLPLDELENLCARLRPRAALLACTRACLLEAQLARLLEVVQRLGSSTRFLLGGAGVSSAQAPLEAAGVICWPAERPLRELADVVRLL